jgi:hypothetical protein
MPIVTCGECSTRLKVPELTAGRAAKCPKCQTTIPLVQPDAAPPAQVKPVNAARTKPLPIPDDEPAPADEPDVDESDANEPEVDEPEVEERPTRKSAAKKFSVTNYAIMAGVYVAGVLTGFFATQLEKEPPVKASGSSSQPVSWQPSPPPPNPSTNTNLIYTPPPVDPKVRANRNLTRDQLRTLVSDMTEQQVIDTLGKPDETTDQGGVAKFWYYRDVAVDPVTGKRNAQVQIMFERGTVKTVNFQ